MPRLKPKEIRALEIKIKKHIGKSYTDSEICEKLDMRPNDLMEYRLRIMEQDKAGIAALDDTTVFSDFLMKMRENIRELDEVRLKFRNRGQWGALVSAVREKRAVYESIIKFGQSLGLIGKKGEELTINGEIITTNEYNEDAINKLIEEEAADMKRMTKGTIIEMRPELIDVSGEETHKFLPEPIQKAMKKATRKKKTRIKLRLNRRV